MINLYQKLADKIAKKMDKETVYKIKDFGKLMANANLAVMHSNDNYQIIEILKDMGYKIEESRIMSFKKFRLNENNK